MRSADIFLSFGGRLDRERWLGAAALFVAVVVATYLATWLMARAGVISAWARDATRVSVQIMLLVPWLTLDWKRFHDLGRSGAWAVVCPSLILAAHWLQAPWSAHRLGAVRGTLADGLAWVQLAVAIWLAYALAYRPGTEGPNRYGPDPREERL